MSDFKPIDVSHLANTFADVFYDASKAIGRIAEAIEQLQDEVADMKDELAELKAKQAGNNNE